MQAESTQRRSARKRIKNKYFFPDSDIKKVKQEEVREEEVGSPKSKCIICNSIFYHSTAFSRRNKLSPLFCRNVLNLFTRFINLEDEEEVNPTQYVWDFEKNPLPFCASCSSTVLGWTKLQEQYEELHSTLMDLGNSCRQKIANSYSSVKLTPDISGDITGDEEVENEFTNYDANIDNFRRMISKGTPALPRKLDGKNKPLTAIKKCSSLAKPDAPKVECEPPEPVDTPGIVSDVESQLPLKVEINDDPIFSDHSELFNSDDSSFSIPDSVLDKKGEESFGEKDASKRPNKIARKNKKTKPANPESSQKTVKRKPRNQKHPKIVITEDGKFYGATKVIEVVDDSGVTKYKCGTCGSVQKTILIFKRHVQQVHQQEPYECEHCGKILQNIGSKSRHMKIYHSAKPRIMLECNLCGKAVTSQRGMTIHKGLIHREGLDKFHLCDICSRPFHNEKEMKTHQWTHMSEEERQYAISVAPDPEAVPTFHTCKYCGKVLSSEASLRSHELIHTCEKPFVCDVCGWAFRHKVNLLKHLETHMEGDETLKFVCHEPDCGKKYRSRTQLRNHSFCHKTASAKPHKCPYCEGFFVRPLDLTVHMRTHTGEKPFQCEVCGKSFSRQHHWSRHMKNVHHVDKPGRPSKYQTDTIVAYIEDFNNSLAFSAEQVTPTTRFNVPSV